MAHVALSDPYVIFTAINQTIGDSFGRWKILRSINIIIHRGEKGGTHKFDLGGKSEAFQGKVVENFAFFLIY